jgi:hypothetical protein
MEMLNQDQAPLRFRKYQSSQSLANKFYIENVVQNNGGHFSEGFQQWLEENWTIYLEFEAQAMRVVMQGRTHYSARTIVEYIRHQTLLAEAGGEFKINNNRVADLARLFAIRKPAHMNLFQYRVSSLHTRPIGAAK